MSNKELKHKKVIVALSIAIPLIVASLFGVRLKGVASLSFLPPIYATVNGITALVLVSAIIAIKNKKKILHERLIKLALLLTSSFLVMYIAYHITSDSTHFGGEGLIKYFYYFILISHIILSVTIIPLVLITTVRGLSKHFEEHKKIARITFPLWLYVAVTGVLVYLMISPYYT